MAVPREIQTEHWPERATFDFPNRPLGNLRFVGLLPIAFAVCFAWLPLQQVVRAARRFLESNAAPFDWAFAAFMSIFVIVAFVPFRLGVFVLAGRTRLVVTRHHLIVTEIAGPLRWSRKMRLAEIERLEVGVPDDSRDTVNLAVLSRLGATTAVLKSGKKRMLLLGYPKEWIEAVTSELSELMRQQGVAGIVTHVHLQKKDEKTLPQDIAAPKPAGTNVSMENRGNGVLITIPPSGLRKGAKGLFSFAVIWCVFMAVFTAAPLWGKAAAKKSVTAFNHVFLLFIGFFWLIGLAMLLGAWNLGRRRATILAEHGDLRVEQKGLFGTKIHQWRRGDIAGVRADTSGITVNDVPLLQIQVHPRTGSKVGLLTGRPEDELRWIAAEMRRALDLREAQLQERPIGQSVTT